MKFSMDENQQKNLFDLCGMKNYGELRLELASHLAEISKVLVDCKNISIALKLDIETARYVAAITGDKELKQKLDQLIPEMKKNNQDFLDVYKPNPR